MDPGFGGTSGHHEYLVGSSTIMIALHGGGNLVIMLILA